MRAYAEFGAVSNRCGIITASYMQHLKAAFA